MTPLEPRGNDRTLHYTMKTSRPASVSSHSTHHHSHSRSQSGAQSGWPAKSTTPTTSPHPPHSVGQPYPHLSPSAASRIPQTPSPNYFGLIVEPATDPRDSAVVPRAHWSPPSSSVKSFATAIPQQVMPLDANPEFEAFKRQADANRAGSTFNLANAGFARSNSGGTPQSSAGGMSLVLPRPRLSAGPAASDESIPTPAGPAPAASQSRDNLDAASSRMDLDTERNSSLGDSAYVSADVSADSKRNSEASMNAPSWFLNQSRHASPAQIESPFGSRTSVTSLEDWHRRSSAGPGRADSEPAKLEAGDADMMSPAALRDILESPAKDYLLLLDVRVATHYAASRVQGALNMCIPTTLLKRATFNLQRLQPMFDSEEQQARFAKWSSMHHLVVYDSSSGKKRDAVAAVNMLKKFTAEGYSGEARVLRGGYNSFATAYPHLIDRSASQPLSSSPLLPFGAGIMRRPTIPVIGGVSLPSISSSVNPFFSNIRQNIDLTDGVGQMDVVVPSTLDFVGLPRWLRHAAELQDRGKAVSQRFLHIELSEQARMKNAYSIGRPGGDDVAADSNIQLSGLEKGGKNRYKDILPFEHARVKLEGRLDGECDYVNASHLKTTRSHKRYIASQGPLPDTFEDFWSVVWDQDVRVIVMLTAESEGGQLKCHPYWTGNEYGAIKLRSLSEKKVSLDIHKHRSQSAESSTSNIETTPGGASSSAEAGRRRANTTTTLQGAIPTPANNSPPSVGIGSETPHVIIRKFALSHTAYPFAPIREITHLHYSSWPDFGAPAQPSHLLALVELANVMQRAALPTDMPSAIGSTSELGSAAPHLVSPHGPTNGKPISFAGYDEPELKAASWPMLVHCSAGCGRTGTFCTVDSVIDMLKRQRMQAIKKANAKLERPKLVADGDGDVPMDLDAVSPLTIAQEPSSLLPSSGGAPVDPDVDGLNTDWLADDSVDIIARTVEDLRTQRLSMVQSLRQFVLCYETVAEWIWRLQDRAGVTTRGRGRSGSLHVKSTG